MAKTNLSRRLGLLLASCFLFVLIPRAACAADKTIAEAMAANPRLSKWIAILKEAKLWESFETSPPVTAFAPTNEALAAIPQASWDALKKSEEDFRRLVLFHFIKGAHAKSELNKKPGRYPTLGGVDIDVKADGKALVLWDGAHTANVLKAETKAKNGVLHVIDTVMQPPAPKM